MELAGEGKQYELMLGEYECWSGDGIVALPSGLENLLRFFASPVARISAIFR